MFIQNKLSLTRNTFTLKVLRAMKKLLLTFLILTFCGWTYDAVAQTADKAPYIDADGNRIPWYLPLPDDGQTRSTVDVRFAPAEMKMVGASPAAAGATKYSDYSVSYGLGLAESVKNNR
jgi:hypothetical protein